MSVQIGDWVRSRQAGIWQIYRIAGYKCQNPLTGLEQNKTMVFAKRFVSNTFKRSFAEQCCDPSLIVPLDLSEKAALDLFIAQNESLYKKFQEYEPKKFDCVHNARIGIPKRESSATITKRLSGLSPIRDVDIDAYLSSLGYDTKATPCWTIQFVSHCCLIDYSTVESAEKRGVGLVVV